MRKSLAFFAVTTVALGSIMPAFAQPPQSRFSGDILVELENDWAFNSDDRDQEVNSLYTTIEAALAYALTDRLSLQTYFVFEPLRAAGPGENTVFDDQGLYAEEVKLVYATENYSVFAGKFDPAFGVAWDQAPGIYGVDFAEDYMLTERIGGGASYSFGDEKTGVYTVTASGFFADTSFLSGSVLAGRNHNSKRDGGVSNTEDISSYSLTLDSDDMAGVEGLDTHLGYLHQAAGSADAGSNGEQGYAAAISYTHPLSENVVATGLVEWVTLQNEAGSNDDVHYLTTGLSIDFSSGWTSALSYTRRQTKISASPDIDDYLVQLSAGYAFENGMMASIAYRDARENGIGTQSVGTLLSYVYSF